MDTINLSLNYSNIAFEAMSNTFKINQPYVLRLSAEWINPPDYNGPLDDSNVVFNIINTITNQNVFPSAFNILPGSANNLEIVNQLDFLTLTNNLRLVLQGGNPNVRAKAQLISFASVKDTVLNYPTAGVRVSSIKNYTANNFSVGFKKFDYSRPDGKSSGSSIVKFNSGLEYTYIDRAIVNDFYCGNYVLSSSSTLGNYANDYGTINYEYVAEFFDSIGTNGTIKSQFLLGENTFAKTFACIIPSNVQQYSPFIIPNASTTNSGFMAGKEFKKTWYKNMNGFSKKIKEVSNFYSTDKRLFHIDSFFIIKKIIDHASMDNTLKYFADYDVNKYNRISAWVHLDSTIQKDTDNFDNELKVKTVYNYDNISNMLPTRLTQLNSEGKLMSKETKYTEDVLQSNPTNTVLKNMQTANLINVPLVNKTFVDVNLITTDSTGYNVNLLPSTFLKSNQNNPLELQVEFTNYDGLGNLQEFVAKNRFNSVLTDTVLGMMIAGCENSSINNIAYTSFETSYNGNWSGISQSNIQVGIGISGSRQLQQSGFVISKSGLDNSKTYVVSYWSKNGAYNVNGSSFITGRTYNGWTYYQHSVSNPVNNTISVNGSGFLDELRLYPKGALMKTYTYEPLVGITSATDANNHSIYYEYDDFNRLYSVRDLDNNIIKKICYNYAGQPQTCGADIIPRWQATGQVRCKPCPANSTYLSNIPERQEKDNNPSSPAYNSTRWVDDGVSSNCVPPADWQLVSNTCQQDAQLKNTGYQTRMEKDMNPCSSTYNQTRQTTVYNTTSCPLPPTCNSSTCTGINKKCINGICTVGTLICISSVREKLDHGFQYNCTFKYCFSDGTSSATYTEVRSSACTVNGPCQ